MLGNFYYESDFEDKMKDFFREKYSLEGLQLEKYLILRYMVINKIKKTNKIKEESFCIFIANELEINSNNEFTYYDNQFYINCSTSQSISNIIENSDLISKLFNNLNDSSFAELNFISEDLIRAGNNAIRNKSNKYKKYLYLKACLNDLNKLFKVTPIFTTFKNVSPINTGLRTLEEICEAYVKDISFDTSNYKAIKEKDLEDYIYNNLFLLLNLTPIQRQYYLNKESIVDIYARDNNIPVLIELKNTSDDRLLWQILKYKKALPSANIIVISTEWSENILEELHKLSYVSIYKALPHISIGKVDKLKLYKL